MARSRIVSVAESGRALASLAPLALAIFGAGDRPPGWFARKLTREAIDAELSSLAFGTGGDLVGYLLVGDEADDPTRDAAHCAGLGVLPPHRGRGLGPALVARSVAALRRRRVPALLALSEPPLRSFYEHLGFHPQAARHTLQTTGLGRSDLDLASHPPAAWPLPGRIVASWRPGTWSRTPNHLAATLSLERGAVHLSREGQAILVQRMCVDAADDHDDHETIAATLVALESLRRCFAATTPILLYGCNTVSCVTAALLHTKLCHVVQTAWEMRLAIREAVDNPGAPAASCRPTEESVP